MNTSITTKKASGLGVICYGLGDLASQFIWTFVGSYLTIFYTDIVGFAVQNSDGSDHTLLLAVRSLQFLQL